ncbi:MAG TPA: ROK family protein [Balneolaceae bacterium]|nr:ROK family protein [Balneolaceae bacterium]
MVAIGIDLGGTNIKAALIDRQNGFIKTVSVPTNADLGKEYVFDRIAEVVAELVSQSKEQPIGIGMGLPGMVSMDRKIVKYPPNLPGWKVERVSEELQKRTGLDTVIENDANLAALGSARFGAGKDFDNFVMITLGTGVGGGIIHQNKIFRGTTGMAGELGHVIIDYHGPLSNSNTRGGIEAYLGQRFLSRYAADTIRQDTENPLYIRFHRDFDKLEPIDLYHAAKEGNELAIEILRKSGEKLGYAIVNYLHILDFRKVIVSGGVANAGDFILQPARDTARRLLMPPFTEGFEIIVESLGNEAALLGAASLAFEEL